MKINLKYNYSFLIFVGHKQQTLRIPNAIDSRQTLRPQMFVYEETITRRSNH